MAEIFYGNSGALCVIVFNAGTFAALTAYGDVKCLVALFFELIYGDVLADFNAAPRALIMSISAAITSFSSL